MDGISGSGVVGIIIGSIVGVMSVIGGIMYMYQSLVSKTAPRQIAIVTAGKTLYYFIPYSLFLFGIIYDAINAKIQYLPAGFVGLLAVFLNYVASSFLYRNERMLERDIDICGIPGMGTLWSRISPQNMLFSTTVLSYITAVNVTLHPSTLKATLSGVSLVIVFLLQLLMYWLNGCYKPVTGQPEWASGAGQYTILVPPIFALAGGLLFGWLFGWGISLLLGPEEEKTE